MSWVNRGSMDDDSYGYRAGGGSVWLSSESDPRWNWNARVSSIWGDETAKRVEELTALYGPPPADLQYGGMKD